MDEILTYWLSVIKSVVWSFFSYHIVDGVSFGSFLVAVLVFAIIIEFIFARIIRKR